MAKKCTKMLNTRAKALCTFCSVLFSLQLLSQLLSSKLNILSWQTLCAEIEIHEAHKDSICKRGEDLVESGHPEAEQVAARKEDLQEKYDNLKKLSDAYKAQLDLSLQAKQVWPVLERFLIFLRE